MILAVDDSKECGWADIVARNADAALLVLFACNGNIDELYIDFDLGKGSMNGLYILRHAHEGECLPNRITIISHNPPGRESMEKFLLDNDYGYAKERLQTYERKT